MTMDFEGKQSVDGPYYGLKVLLRESYALALQEALEACHCRFSRIVQAGPW